MNLRNIFRPNFLLNSVPEKVALEITKEILINFGISDDNKWPILIHTLKLHTFVFFK